jgi:diadenosine tetraphosphate (Ap4A) HIT family hydrolase
MPRERWDALVRGEGCPPCAAVAATEPADAYGYTVADLDLSRLRLAANQSVPGYCVLICARHVREPYDLSVRERAIFFEDMMRAARALEGVFAPVKMNFEILGNAVPHLHCHIKPRYYGDSAPGAPIDPDAARVLLGPPELAERVGAIRAALARSRSTD